MSGCCDNAAPFKMIAIVIKIEDSETDCCNSGINANNSQVYHTPPDFSIFPIGLQEKEEAGC